MKRGVKNRIRKVREKLIGKPVKLILVEHDGLYCDSQAGIAYTEEELETLDQEIIIIRIMWDPNCNE